MLALTRRIGETLVIGEGPDQITVTVVSTNNTGSQVKLSVSAPRHIAVHRKEIYDRIQAEKAAAK